jgi:hypothetical protein
VLIASSIVFVHGLRGHPRGTWETTAGASHDSSDTSKQSKGLSFLFRRRERQSLATETEQAQGPSTNPAPSSPLPHTVFWPEEYLVRDIPHACVWTYGYNADVIGGLFQANNKNSISQHGRDLSVRLEREIDNRVWARTIAKSCKRQNSSSSSGRRTGAAGTQVGARSLRTSLVWPCKTRTNDSSRLSM